jgi:hypothetical protein
MAYGFLSPEKVVVRDRSVVFRIEPFVSAGQVGIVGTF